MCEARARSRFFFPPAGPCSGLFGRPPLRGPRQRTSLRPHYHRLFPALKRYSSRTMAAALDGLIGSDWLSNVSERRAMISFSVSRIAASISAGHLCLSDLSSCSAIALARCFGFMSITITWVSKGRPRIAPRPAIIQRRCISMAACECGLCVRPLAVQLINLRDEWRAWSRFYSRGGLLCAHGCRATPASPDALFRFAQLTKGVRGEHFAGGFSRDDAILDAVPFGYGVSFVARPARAGTGLDQSSNPALASANHTLPIKTPRLVVTQVRGDESCSLNLKSTLPYGA
jgi:hypothetical protein